MNVRKLVCAGPFLVLFLFFAAPAFAQFEVSPDHFDNQPSQTPKKPVTTAKKKTSQGSTASQVVTNPSPANPAGTPKTAATLQHKKTGPGAAPAKKSTAASASSKAGKSSAKASQPTLKAQFAPTPRE